MLFSKCRLDCSGRSTSGVYPAWLPQSLIELKQALPADLPVTREALTGQVSYLHRPPSPQNDYLTPPGKTQAPAVVSDLELFIGSGN